MSTAAWIALGALVVISGVWLLLLREFVVLVRGQPAITTITRRMILHWPGTTLSAIGLILFALGALFAHLVWDAGSL